jgi:hypothetical protein
MPFTHKPKPRERPKPRETRKHKFRHTASGSVTHISSCSYRCSSHKLTKRALPPWMVCALSQCTPNVNITHHSIDVSCHECSVSTHHDEPCCQLLSAAGAQRPDRHVACGLHLLSCRQWAVGRPLVLHITHHGEPRCLQLLHSSQNCLPPGGLHTL